MELSPDGDIYAILTWSGRVLFGNPMSAQPVRELDTRSTFDTIALSPSGRVLATVDGNGRIQLWDVATQRALGFLAPRLAKVLGLEFSLDGGSLCAIDSSGTLSFWESGGWKETGSRKIDEKVWTDEHFVLKTLALSPDHKRFAVAHGLDALLIDIHSGNELAAFRGHRGDI